MSADFLGKSMDVEMSITSGEIMRDRRMQNKMRQFQHLSNFRVITVD